MSIFGKGNPSGSGTPDFAFPKKVSQQASSQLQQALKRQAGVKVLEALINYTTAENLVNQDNIDRCLELIISSRDELKTEADRQMVNMLLGNVYLQYYQTNWRSFNDRSYIEEPIMEVDEDGVEYPTTAVSDGSDSSTTSSTSGSSVFATDPSKLEGVAYWSAKQFADNIWSLIEEALSHRDQLLEVALENYADVVTHDKHTWEYYPTVYDFVVTQSISLWSSIGTVSQSWNDVRQWQDSLYKSLAEAHPDDPQPEINFLLKLRNCPCQELYEKYNDIDSPSCIDALIPYVEPMVYGSSIQERQKAYDLVEGALKKYPSYWKKDNLVNIKNELLSQRVDVNCPQFVITGKPFKVEVTDNNTDRIIVAIYDQHKRLAYSKEINADSLKTRQKGPFELKVSLDATLDKDGTYTIVAEKDGKIKPKKYYPTLVCSSLYGMYANIGQTNFVMALNPVNGQPIEDVKVRFVHTSRRSTPDTISLGKTDMRGIAMVPQQKESQYGTFYLSDDKGGAFDFSGSIRNNYYGRSDMESATGFTSLTLYRPGDYVEWTFVVSVLKEDGSKLLLSGEKFEVKLYDANYQVIEDLEFASDEYGRVSGLWKLPDTGLTGDFHLEIMRPNTNRQIGSVYFTVSDYKMPTFKVELEPVSLSENGDTVTFKGKAVTYSGFPVADSDVTLYFNRATLFWRWHHVEQSSFWSIAGKTDADGSFTIEVPAQRFKDIDSWLFQVRADVVSSTGERRSGSELFVVNKPYGIQCQIPSVIDLSGKCDFDIAAMDPSGEKVDIVLDFTLYTPNTNDKEKVYSCALENLDWKKLPSGEYDLEISPKDPKLAYPYRSRVILYRPTDKQSPVKNVLWVPKSSYTYNSSGEADILYAVAKDNTVVSIFSVKKDGTFTDVFYPDAEGFHTFKVFQDDGIYEVVLCTVVEGVPSQLRVNIAPAPAPSMILKAESFRDNLIPSEQEKWSFKVTVGGKGVASAIMADLYNAALDQIKPHSWAEFPWNSWKPYTPSLWINTTYSAKGNVYTSFFQNNPSVKTQFLVDPEFQTYGRNFGLGSDMVYFKTSRSMAMNSMKKEASVDYAMMDMAQAVEEEATMEAPASVALTDEVAAAGAAAEGAAEDDADSAQEQAQEEFQFRNAETPLAFFRPLLNTDKDGNLDISFIVPNANTTWRLMLRGWTKQLQWSSLIREFVASKPLMVQPNLPRFLRNGDVAFVESEVMNNTDKVLEVEVLTELFDPQNQKVLITSTERVSIEANSSKTVSQEIVTDMVQSMIGFRIKATAMVETAQEGETSPVMKQVGDGEQSVIPVLASRVSVTESEQFYIAPQQREETINLQTLTEKADIVLSYCDNPQWYCVTALPTLQKEPAQTSVSAAGEIYSIAIARKLLSENPELAKALKDWEKAGDKDSMLISMLQRNQDLKIALLSSTPWVRQAQSDTERMARLTMLFNRNITDKVLATAVETLNKLKDPKGGWSWFSPESDPSLWATVSVLNLMGQLNSMGMLPEDKSLRSMISQSVKWLDSEMVDIHKNSSRGGDYSYYVVVRDYFPEYPLSSAAQRVVNYTVQYVLDNWRMHSLYQKTLDTSIFQNHGYGKTAKVVLESIQEYSESTPEKGTWFPSLYSDYSYGYICNTPVAVTAKILESYANIEPKSPMIEGLRQWLILQKQGQDWGNSTSTAQVITAIFSSSKTPLSKAGQVLVSIDGKPISGAYEHYLTGEIEMEIPQSARQIELKRNGQATPGWGAVLYQYESNPKSVKPASCNQISIQKETLIQQPVTGEGSQPLWSRSSTFSKGGLARIRLTLTVNDDLDYVMISDDRCAGFEPVNQLPQYVWSQGISFYRETLDSTTNIFVNKLPKGVYVLEYDVVANNIGNFSSGLATAQSQYAPTVVAHSSAAPIQIKP